VQVLRDALDVGLKSFDAELAESIAGVRQKVNGVAEVVNEHRLADVQFKVARDPAVVTATSLPNTCTATMIMASHCVGLTFPA